MQRTKLVGPALILTGLLFLTSAYLSLDDVGAETYLRVYNELQWWQFWIPHSYDAHTIPEYTITNLIIGTATLTAGTILTIQERRKTHKCTATTQTLKEN
ncbi:MAG: hypothetical protein ABIJ47_08060 [Candidatus Bathyarchaeota archaeon]